MKKLLVAVKGGPGSGNWGHAGRPGMRGGSSGTRGAGGAVATAGGGKVETDKEKFKRELVEYHRMEGSTTIEELKELASKDDTYMFKLDASLLLDGGVNVTRVTQSAPSGGTRMLNEVAVGFHKSVDDVTAALDDVGALYRVDW